MGAPLSLPTAGQPLHPVVATSPPLASQPPLLSLPGPLRESLGGTSGRILVLVEAFSGLVKGYEGSIEGEDFAIEHAISASSGIASEMCYVYRKH